MLCFVLVTEKKTKMQARKNFFFSVIRGQYIFKRQDKIWYDFFFFFWSQYEWPNSSWQSTIYQIHDKFLQRRISGTYNCIKKDVMLFNGILRVVATGKIIRMTVNYTCQEEFKEYKQWGTPDEHNPYIYSLIEQD